MNSSHLMLLSVLCIISAAVAKPTATDETPEFDNNNHAVASDLGGGASRVLLREALLRVPPRQLRGGLDSLSGISFGTNKRAFDSLSGVAFGGQKRNFDEIDRSAFDSFLKRNFDEIDRSAFDSFVKRNFDEIDRVGFNSFYKRRSEGRK